MSFFGVGVRQGLRAYDIGRWDVLNEWPMAFDVYTGVFFFSQSGWRFCGMAFEHSECAYCITHDAGRSINLETHLWWAWLFSHSQVPCVTSIVIQKKILTLNEHHCAPVELKRAPIAR